MFSCCLRWPAPGHGQSSEFAEFPPKFEPDESWERGSCWAVWGSVASGKVTCPQVLGKSVAVASGDVAQGESRLRRRSSVAKTSEARTFAALRLSGPSTKDRPERRERGSSTDSETTIQKRRFCDSETKIHRFKAICLFHAANHILPLSILIFLFPLGLIN